VPIELPSFLWISGVNQFYSILAFIGIIFLGLGVILFFLLTKKKERILKEIELDSTQIKWFMNTIKITLIIGGLLFLFTISDIISVLLFTSTPQFSLVEIGDQIQRFTTVYFFLLIGIFLFIIGVLLFRKNQKIYATKTEAELTKMFCKRNLYFYVNAMVIGFLFLLIFGRSLPFFIDALNRVLKFYNWLDPYAIRFFSILSIVIFNTFLGILLIIYGLLCFILRKRNLEKTPKILKTSKKVEKRKKIVGITMIGIGIIPHIFSGFGLFFWLPEVLPFPVEALGSEYYYLLPLNVLIAILSILLIVNGVLLLTIKAEYIIDLQLERKNMNNH
jgi:Flp pilus assembly protein protease CpaA